MEDMRGQGGGGFGGMGNTFVYQDLVDFPNLAKRVFGDPGRSRRKTPACNGPISVPDLLEAHTDVEHLQAALGAVLDFETRFGAATAVDEFGMVTGVSVDDLKSAAARLIGEAFDPPPPLLVLTGEMLPFDEGPWPRMSVRADAVGFIE